MALVTELRHPDRAGVEGDERNAAALEDGSHRVPDPPVAVLVKQSHQEIPDTERYKKVSVSSRLV